MTHVPLPFSFLHQWGEISRFAISYARITAQPRDQKLKTVMLKMWNLIRKVNFYYIQSTRMYILSFLNFSFKPRSLWSKQNLTFPSSVSVFRKTRQWSALRARPRFAWMFFTIPRFLYWPPLVVPHIGPGLQGPQGQIRPDHPIITKGFHCVALASKPLRK